MKKLYVLIYKDLQNILLNKNNNVYILLPFVYKRKKNHKNLHLYLLGYKDLLEKYIRN